jgi:hypothetical protein
VICTEMEASKSMPHRQPWQELLGCEQLSTPAVEIENLYSILLRQSNHNSLAGSMLQSPPCRLSIRVHDLLTIINNK